MLELLVSKLPVYAMYSAACSSRKDYHHRTEINKKGYMIGTAIHKEGGKLIKYNRVTETNLIDKSINPMGGFPHYDEVKEDSCSTAAASDKRKMS